MMDAHWYTACLPGHALPVQPIKQALQSSWAHHPQPGFAVQLLPFTPQLPHPAHRHPAALGAVPRQAQERRQALAADAAVEPVSGPVSCLNLPQSKLLQGQASGCMFTCCDEAAAGCATPASQVLP
jgi:hypothetical protein